MRVQRLPVFVSDGPIEVPIGEWIPDQPQFSGVGSSLVQGCVPLTQQSYGPASSFASAGANALAARCQGAIAVKNSTGNIYHFAGTGGASNAILYGTAANSLAFSNLNPTGVPSFDVDPAEFWSFAQFGDRILAAQLNNEIQTYLIGTDSLFSGISSAPSARHIGVLRDFAVVLNVHDTGAGKYYRNRVWWSAIGDPTNWPTPGTNAAVAVESDYQDLYDGELGFGTGIVGPLGAADGALFFESGIYRMQYVGSPAVWDFQVAQGAKGSRFPGSIVLFNNVAYYLSDDGFYAFDGATARPIGAGKWNNWFYTNLDPANRQRVQGVADPVNNLIWWCIPSIGNSGTSFYLIAYHVIFDRASYIQLPVGIEFLTSGFQNSSYGGIPVLGAFDTTHTLNFATGSSLAVTAETEEKQFFGGRRARVKSVRPLDGLASPTVSVGVRDTLLASPTYGPAVALNALGECPQNIEGRYVRAHINIPAGNTFTHLVGATFKAIPRGFR